MNITIFIVIITSIVSIIAFQNHEIFDKFKFNAFAVKHSGQWYRAFTYGLLHADWAHLAINMFVLYSFGGVVELIFKSIFPEKYILYFLLLYIGGISFSIIFDMKKYKDEPSYNAVGASGAVSAIVFASILLYPIGKISLLFIPIGIPSFVFGILYLVYSAYMDKKKIDNIGHSAHFWGAVFGFVFPILIKPTLFVGFINQILFLLQ